MSPEKCCCLIFSKRANLKFKFNLSMYGSILPCTKEHRFLGVSFDECLSFTGHIDFVIKKCSSRLNIIKIVSHNFD